jgi:transposase
MRRVLSADYDQLLLLAPSVEEWIGPAHPARFIREFVGALDLRELKLDTLERHEGGTAHEPALLLQAWLYGYLRKIRSTRGLENACREEMGFVWLTGNHRPDHNALWRFWQAHREGIRQLFRQSVKVALELNLVGLAVQALDGTKIAAAASGHGGFDRRHLQKLLARLDEQITEREGQIAQAGAEASAATELPPILHLREQVRAALARVASGETNYVHPLEPDAARMECDGRNRFGYNAQALVDAHAQIIVAADVTSAPNDTQELVPMIAQAQANCAASASAPAPEPSATPTAPPMASDGEAPPLTLADGGYATSAQLAAAERCGYPVVTPPPPGWCDTTDAYHTAHFRHDSERKLVICPQGRELHYKGVRQKDRRQVEIYRNGAACKNCPVRAQCTSDRQGRAIYIGADHAVVVASHRRWQQPQTAEFYAMRAATVEPVFAQVKQQMGFRRWTVRGLENVRTQWTLLATTWNLRVLFRHWRAGPGGHATASRPVPPPLGAAGRCASIHGRFARPPLSPRFPLHFPPLLLAA